MGCFCTGARKRVQMAEAAAACFDALAYFSAGDRLRMVDIQLN